MGFQMIELSNQDQLAVASISLRGRSPAIQNTAFFSASFVPSMRRKAGLEDVRTLPSEGQGRSQLLGPVYSRATLRA